jgi:hypothetical protein
MRKLIFGVILLFLPAALLLLAQQEQEQETVREEVKVVNVEVPVRVFYKGEPVANLNRADFKLYEDDKLQEITGFNVKRSKIKFQDIALQVEEKKTYLSRYFVLVYRITEYSPSIKKGLKHIFDKVLREQDELRVFVNDKSLYFANLSGKPECQNKVDRVLAEQSKKARQRLQSYLRALEQQVDRTKFKMFLKDMAIAGNAGSTNDRQKSLYLKQFLQRYLQVWREYKKRYLIPDIDIYYNFAKHLEGIKKEKWVINFYQMEMFPQISIAGEARRMVNKYITQLRLSSSADDKSYARILDRMLRDIDRELNMVDEFPSEAISKIFYKVEAAFHTIFMRSSLRIVSQDYNYKKVSSDIENSLREITKTTGGTLVATNNLEKAMDTIGEKENIYYLLTYSPDDPGKKGKIKITVNKRKHKVIYDDNMRADYLKGYLAKKESQAPVSTAGGPAIRIKNLEFKDKKLSISVDGFYLQKTSGGPAGKMGIRIRVKNIQGASLFDQQKALALNKDDISITIPFNNLKKGKYDIIVDVKDLLSGKTDTKLIQPKIK